MLTDRDWIEIRFLQVEAVKSEAREARRGPNRIKSAILDTKIVT